ncbi:hypothetical protein D0N36_09195 [Hymenobacter lapidiphilus]|uniref:hypothetical protein n=1 Tax=Hymenobacter sp. CCM 8763 TaxID=2303334 RepID=UPI000E3473C6|nr:hypothetical protein [Hymenobacter sp. CCM 8763]RFP65433.1 hypothetical protein D0N36_09195 [Hymenobacter sp. CCM 8763]
MQISQNIDLTDDSSCTVYYEELPGWLRAVWLGYVDVAEAYAGAGHLLEVEQQFRCPYLLNDNSGLRGPWFDSMDWLSQVWLPRAMALGLRYVAHVPQPGGLAGEMAAVHYAPLPEGLEIQVFDNITHAEQWLREMQAAQPE